MISHDVDTNVFKKLAVTASAVLTMTIAVPQTALAQSGPSACISGYILYYNELADASDAAAAGDLALDVYYLVAAGYTATRLKVMGC